MEPSRLVVGVDVPWVTSWTAEPVLGAAPCPTVDGRLAIRQAERPGFGKPQYSMNHHRRQRASIRGLLCPMCGEPAPEGDRWTLVAKWTTAGKLRRKGLAACAPPDVPDERVVLNAGSVSPGHLACMTRSQALCPHLHADRSARLIAFPERWYVSLLQTEVALGADVPAGAARLPAAIPIPVVTFLQLCGVTGRADPKWRRGPTARTVGRGKAATAAC